MVVQVAQIFAVIDVTMTVDYAPCLYEEKKDVLRDDTANQLFITCN